MKEGDWEECVHSGLALPVTPNQAKATSLIGMAEGRIRYLKEQHVTEASANYIFEGYYASVVEMLHALLLLRGYTVGNHVCLGYYLRDAMKRTGLFRIFDDCRFKRNSLLYYGRSMDFGVAKEAIQKCEKLVAELLTIIEQESR